MSGRCRLRRPITGIADTKYIAESISEQASNAVVIYYQLLRKDEVTS